MSSQHPQSTVQLRHGLTDRHLSQATLRLLNTRSIPPDHLWLIFSHACQQLNLPPPSPLLLPNGPASRNNDIIAAVFSSPRDARIALATLSSDSFALAPFNNTNSDTPHLPVQTVIGVDQIERSRVHSPDNMSPSFTISSNPPNPRSTFRAGDWMCPSSACCAHNFQRNTTCITCGRPRSGVISPLPTESPAMTLSPRFAGIFHAAPQTVPSSASPITTSSSFSVHAASSALAAAHAQMPAKAPPPQYPPLTPSGRALSVGGRVRNVSLDPLSPCIMYWPDNEPLPDPSQIRPVDSALITYPPIVNTGNKGVAEKQPGDWVCGKCNYHNWRRRKVCQTCFPYAEGNGDSISAAVQAERIALLTNVLCTQFNALDVKDHPSHPPISASPHPSCFLDGSPVYHLGRGNSRNVSPRLPPLGLSKKDVLPIYQTSGGPTLSDQQIPRTLLPYGSAATMSPYESHKLLPSFLQDLVQPSPQSPSPTSSSSADLSADSSSEDVHYVLTPSTCVSTTHAIFGNTSGACASTARKGSVSSFHSLGRQSIGSIWKLDGEESKTLTPSSSSSTTSSARTSPTTAYAQATMIPPRASQAIALPATLVDHGAGPKRTGSFW